MASFASYDLGAVLHPRPTFDALLTDPRRLKFGLLAMVINAVLYTLVYVFLYIGGGAPSTFKPWLAIPADVYYRYDRFILAPSMFGCWILAAGVAQLLSKPFKGRGTFENNLSVFGFAIGIASLASLGHGLTDSFLGAVGLLDLRWYETALNSATIWRTILWILIRAFAGPVPGALPEGCWRFAKASPASRDHRGSAVLPRLPDRLPGLQSIILMRVAVAQGGVVPPKWSVLSRPLRIGRAGVRPASTTSLPRGSEARSLEGPEQTPLCRSSPQSAQPIPTILCAFVSLRLTCTGA